MLLRKQGFMTTSWTLVSASWANMLHAVDRGNPELGSALVGMLLWSMNTVHQLVESITAMCRPFCLLREYAADSAGCCLHSTQHHQR